MYETTSFNWFLFQNSPVLFEKCYQYLPQSHCDSAYLVIDIIELEIEYEFDGIAKNRVSKLKTRSCCIHN